MNRSPFPGDALATLYSAKAQDDGLAGPEREAAILFAVAEGHVNEGEDYEGALRAGNDALALFRQAGDTKGEADTVRLIVHAYRTKSEVLRCDTQSSDTSESTSVLREAESMARDSLKTFRESGDKRGEACMLLSIAEVNYDKKDDGERDLALQSAMDARRLAEELEDVVLEANALLALSNVYCMMAGKSDDSRYDFKQALHFANEALTRFRANANKSGEAKALHALSSAQLNSKYIEAAVESAKAAAEVWSELGCQRMRAFELVGVAECHLQEGKPKKALKAVSEASEIFSKIGSNKCGDIRALDVLVNAHIKNGNADEALLVAEESQNQFNKIGNDRGVAAAACNVMRVHFANNAKPEALAAADVALEGYRKLGDKTAVASLLQSLSMVHVADDDFIKGAEYSQEALSLYRETGEKTGEGVARWAAIDMALARNRPEHAMDECNAALELFKEEKNKSGQAAALNSMSGVHLFCEEYEEAEAKAKQAQKMFQQEQNRLGEVQSLQMIAEVHMATLDYKAALTAAKRARVLGKELNDKRKEVDLVLLVAQNELNYAKNAPARPGRSMPAGFDKAVSAAKEAVTLSKKLGEQGLVAHSLYQHANTLNAIGKVPEAMKVIFESLAICRKHGEKRLEGFLLILQAHIHKDQGERAKAEEVANKAAAILREVGDWESEQEALSVVGVYQAPGAQSIETVGYVPASSAGPSAAVVSNVYKGPDAKQVADRISQMAQELIGESVGDDTPLMDAGLDSLSMVDFRNKLVREFDGIKMSASFLFDHPTISALSNNVAENLKNQWEKSHA